MGRKAKGGLTTKSGLKTFGVNMGATLFEEMTAHIEKLGVPRSTFITLAVRNELDRANYAQQLIDVIKKRGEEKNGTASENVQSADS